MLRTPSCLRRTMVGFPLLVTVTLLASNSARSDVVCEGTAVSGGGRVTINGRRSTDSSFVQGNGRIVTTSRAIPSSVTEITVGGRYQVQIQRGQTASLSITAESNLQDLLTSQAFGSDLDLGTSGCYNSTSTPKAFIVLPELSRITVNGASDVSMSGPWSGPKLEVEVRGTGDVRASQGTYDRLTVRVKGTGDVRLGSLRARFARVDVQGTGDATVRVSESVIARVQGTGDIVILGNPPKRSIRSEGSGDITFQ